MSSNPVICAEVHFLVEKCYLHWRVPARTLSGGFLRGQIKRLNGVCGSYYLSAQKDIYTSYNSVTVNIIASEAQETDFKTRSFGSGCSIFLNCIVRTCTDFDMKANVMLCEEHAREHPRDYTSPCLAGVSRWMWGTSKSLCPYSHFSGQLRYQLSN